MGRAVEPARDHAGRPIAKCQRFGGDIALVVVQKARELSRRIETETGLRHESPQAIVLRNGEAVWSASHWSITIDALQSAMRQHQ